MAKRVKAEQDVPLEKKSLILKKDKNIILIRVLRINSGLDKNGYL